MRLDKNSLKLYAVTDRKWLNGSSLEEEVEKAVRAGVTMVQLREKNMKFDEIVSLAKKIGAITCRYDVPLIINDNIEAVLASGADGLHVGQEDAKIISLNELKRICVSVSIPVVAIGGINEENIRKLSGSGIAGAAVVSAIFAKGDVAAAASRLLTLTEKMLESK